MVLEKTLEGSKGILNMGLEEGFPFEELLVNSEHVSENLDDSGFELEVADHKVKVLVLVEVGFVADPALELVELTQFRVLSGDYDRCLRV